MSAPSRSGAAVPFKSLQYFLNRSQVLAQYKEFLRITQPLEDATRRDVREQIRAGFELYRDVEDDKKVALFLRQGKTQLKHVSDLVDSAVARQRVAEAATSVVTDKQDSWVQATGDEADAQEDVKGRLGTGWPWKKQEPLKKIELEGVKRR